MIGGHMTEKRDPICDAIANLRRDLGEQAEREAAAGQWEECAATLCVVLALCPDPMAAPTGQQMQDDARRRGMASAGLISAN